MIHSFFIKSVIVIGQTISDFIIIKKNIWNVPKMKCNKIFK